MSIVHEQMVAKRLGIIFITLFLCSVYCLGQEETYKTSPQTGKSTAPSKKDSKFNWDKVYLGGGLGLQFGSYTLIDLSPLIGYRFTEDLSGGMGISYQYISVKNPSYSSYTYGGGPFARYVIFNDLFAHTEYQILNSEYILVDQYQRILSTFRESVHYFWVGGGYRQQLGGNAYLMLMALWNLNDSALSIYRTNPIIRMGINVGL